MIYNYLKIHNYSKFYERVMHSLLLEFAERLEILCYNQSGFRKNHSTNLALIHLTNKISSSIDHREITAGVFLGLSKACDTINHDILCHKLECYGIRGVALHRMDQKLSVLNILPNLCNTIMFSPSKKKSDVAYLKAQYWDH